MRIEEIDASIAMMQRVLLLLPDGEIRVPMPPTPMAEGLGWTESPRGIVVLRRAFRSGRTAGTGEDQVAIVLELARVSVHRARHEHDGLRDQRGKLRPHASPAARGRRDDGAVDPDRAGEGQGNHGLADAGRATARKACWGCRATIPDLCTPGCGDCADGLPDRKRSQPRPDGGGLDIDYGRCVVCQLCTEACPTSAMAHLVRLGLRRTPPRGPAMGRAKRRGGRTRARSASGTAFRRSLHIRHVDAGSCNGCESELQALNNPFYNLHRLGIFFTPSPRFADLLLVTGPVTHAMEGPLRTTYEAMPQPRWVMAIGTCAVSGGIAEGGYACGHGLEGVMPVDVYLPGCPPNPAAIIEALLMFLGPRAATRERGTHWRMNSWPPRPCCGSSPAASALIGRPLGLARVLLGFGGLAAIVAAVVTLPGWHRDRSPFRFAWRTRHAHFQMAPEALWLMGFGLVPACPRLPAGVAVTGRSRRLAVRRGVQPARRAGRVRPGARRLLFAGLGVDEPGRRGDDPQRTPFCPNRASRCCSCWACWRWAPIALLVAILLLALPAHGLTFEAFARVAPTLAVPVQIALGVLLVIGFGAKLGLLPFYEWFPGAYGSGSGASGALLSGVILNAAFFGLSRGLLRLAARRWARRSHGLGIFVVAIGVFSAILAVLYAFQQEDWRRLLEFFLG